MMSFYSYPALDRACFRRGRDKKKRKRRLSRGATVAVNTVAGIGAGGVLGGGLGLVLGHPIAGAAAGSALGGSLGGYQGYRLTNSPEGQRLARRAEAARRAYNNQQRKEQSRNVRLARQAYSRGEPGLLEKMGIIPNRRG